MTNRTAKRGEEMEGKHMSENTSDYYGNDSNKNTSGKFANLYCALSRKSRESLRITLASGTVIVGQLVVFDDVVFIVNTVDEKHAFSQILITRSQIATMALVSGSILINATADAAIMGRDLAQADTTSHRKESR